MEDKIIRITESRTMWIASTRLRNGKYYNNYFTKTNHTCDEAYEQALTLDNCESCIDCSNCKACKNCAACVDCIHCKECFDCTGCVNCTKCTRCDKEFELEDVKRPRKDNLVTPKQPVPKRVEDKPCVYQDNTFATALSVFALVLSTIAIIAVIVLI